MAALFSCSGIQLLGAGPLPRRAPGGRWRSRRVFLLVRRTRAAAYGSADSTRSRPGGWRRRAAAPPRSREAAAWTARPGKLGWPGPAWRPGATSSGLQGPSWGAGGSGDGWWWAFYFAFSSLCRLSEGRELWRQLRGGEASSGVGRAVFASGPRHQLAE